jgi:Iap family predicted aminopeptidase
MLERVVGGLAGIGSHDHGFRVTGTPEDRRAARFVTTEMRAIGLEQVAIEQVPVDSWRFTGGSVTLDDGTQWQCASLGSVPPTPPRGVTGELVMVGDGRRSVLDKLDLAGRIALLDWRRIPVGIADVCLELGARGVTAVVVTSLDGGARFQGENALGSSVSGWHDGAPPAITLRKRDAYELLARSRAGAQTITVRLEVKITHNASGCNAVGVLPGRRSDLAPIVVGAHHDAWFSGAWDNASGVASLLVIAKALAQGGWRPRRPVWFVSHTAEEYGRIGDPMPWCFGAWQQLALSHPRWGGTVPFYLNIEASGHPKLPVLVEASPELKPFAAPFFRRALRDGVLPNGWWFSGDPATGTEAWPFQLAGIPSMSVYNWHKSIVGTDYHTTNDVPSLVDFGYLANLTRVYLDLLVAAEQSVDRLLDYGARRDHLRLATGNERLRQAADQYAQAGSRVRFRRLMKGGIGVDAHGDTTYLHAQAEADVVQLGRALEALARGDRRAATRAALKVGDNAAYSHLSHPAFSTMRRRDLGSRGSWPAKSHLTTWPDLWNEIASLRCDSDATPFGPWVTHSFERHRKRIQRERDRRIARLATLLEGRTSS